MTFILTVFRIIGTITGLPFNWIFFKKKIYYEDGCNRGCFRRGGALVISNHFSPLDYVSNAFMVFPRKLNVVTSELAYNHRISKYGMRFFGGIQANRVTKNMRFIKESAELIKKGQLVQIFPEGHNTDDGTIKRFFPSYIAIAQIANAPIIPVVTDGNYGLFKRTHLIVGNKINLSDYSSSEDTSRKAETNRLNDIVRGKVIELREELDRRVKNEKMQKRRK